ncbi:hypothetical protein KA001_01795, partial [Patescibacteria group bacterium]|nr:hypothetical protein [Patescibacteria group bacterium]
MGYKLVFLFLSFILYLLSFNPVFASDYGITNTLIFSKILDNTPNIDRQLIGDNYFLVSDENENFYVESVYGFYKFD